tara:strand:- start:83 stop:619 length:537 start_codon:yes stop_codon:yes gene_type:complete
VFKSHFAGELKLIDRRVKTQSQRKLDDLRVKGVSKPFFMLGGGKILGDVGEGVAVFDFTKVVCRGMGGAFAVPVFAMLCVVAQGEEAIVGVGSGGGAFGGEDRVFFHFHSWAENSPSSGFPHLLAESGCGGLSDKDMVGTAGGICRRGNPVAGAGNVRDGGASGIWRCVRSNAVGRYH